MKKMPQRRCVGCGVSKDKGDLIRVVRSPAKDAAEGSETPEPSEINKAAEPEASIDLKGKKPGRGAYICKDEECLKKALKARKFERGLQIKISETLAESLLNQIRSD